MDLGRRSYPIFVGAGLLADPALIAGKLSGNQVLVVTNDVVGPLYLDSLLSALLSDGSSGWGLEP